MKAKTCFVTNTYKLFFNILVIFLLCFQSFSPVFIYAASSYYGSIALSVRNMTNGESVGKFEINAKPGDSLRLLLSGRNTSSVNNISNPRSSFTFSTNRFSYSSSSIYIQNVYGPVTPAISEFNPPSDNLVNLGNTADVQKNYIPASKNAYVYNFDITLNQNINVQNFVIKGKYLGDNTVDSDYGEVRVHVDSAPHLKSYAFMNGLNNKTSIKNDGVDALDLVIKVFDYNGCTNIDGSSVYVDLSALGLSSSTLVPFQGCEADNITAIYKLSNITTVASPKSFTIQKDDILVDDEDGNSYNSADPYFGSQTTQESYSLSIVPGDAPVLDNLSLSDDYIGGSTNQTAQISFSADKSGTAKIVVNGNGNSCSDGTLIRDWYSYTTPVVDNSNTISYSSLNEGNNTIYVCVKDGGNNIGQASFSITRDTTIPGINDLVISPDDIITGSSVVSYRCSEDGSYQVCLNQGCTGIGDISSGATLAGVVNSGSIADTKLAVGDNTVYLRCRDNAQNTLFMTGNINKQSGSPSMAGRITAFADNDVDNQH